MTAPEVLFISKPIAPPFRDGSKCLVRDLCAGFERTHAHVMSVRGAQPELSGSITFQEVYAGDGGFAPGLRQNAAAMSFLLTRSPTNLWHTVFAPNPRSSAALGAVRRLRGARCVQTVASAPRSFDRPERLLFGDRVVTLSEWTKERFEAAFRDAGLPAPPILHIPPPAPEVSISSEQRGEARARRGFRADPGEGPPLFIYPGDLEVSRGADFVLELGQALQARLGRVRILIAYRDKTPGAAVRAAELMRRADAEIFFFERNVSDLHALLAGATGVLFPVDDLFAKVDLPIVLLEAMSLGTPVLALDRGPLRSLVGAELLPEQSSAWVEAAVGLASRPEFRQGLVAAGQRAVAQVFHRERIAREYESVYAELMGDGSRD